MTKKHRNSFSKKAYLYGKKQDKVCNKFGMKVKQTPLSLFISPEQVEQTCVSGYHTLQPLKIEITNNLIAFLGKFHFLLLDMNFLFSLKKLEFESSTGGKTPSSIKKSIYFSKVISKLFKRQIFQVITQTN